MGKRAQPVFIRCDFSGLRTAGFVAHADFAQSLFRDVEVKVSLGTLRCTFVGCSFTGAEARGSAGLALLAAALLVNAVWLLGRAPLVGVWVAPEAVVVRGWLRTTVLDRGRPVDVRAARYDGALVRGRSALLWYLVVHSPDHEERRLRVTTTTQRRALQRCRQLEDVLAAGQPA
ncbi:hypothetical protein [Actinotalea sp. Marseille-Q4924]|uniref:hypothetical protein n=1 Tax=Actinotalea sp. Marseille-Q4924 TaxID=2866571 RepID=UPI001CE3D7D5|nr:hypothetical protein [Actinotalea sp. Marseille-Q4924]